jgi:hypothetical protein
MEARLRQPTEAVKSASSLPLSPETSAFIGATKAQLGPERLDAVSAFLRPLTVCKSVPGHERLCR